MYSGSGSDFLADKSFKKFLVFWGGQTFSELGRAVTVFALNLLLADVIYNTTPEKEVLAFSLASLTAIYYIGYVLSQPLAGSLTDRYDRKKILLIANYLGGIVTLSVSLLLFFNVYHFVILVLLNLIIGIIRSFIVSAFSASYVMIVPEKHLNRANGMTQTVFSFSNIFAPAITVFFISVPSAIPLFPDFGGFTNFAFVIGLDALTYLLACISLHLIKIPSPGYSNKSQTKIYPSKIIKDIVEGFSYINTSFIWLLSMSALGNILIPIIITLQPLLVKFTLSNDLIEKGIEFDLALATLSTLTSLGGLLGGLIITTIGGIKGKNKIYGVIIPLVISGIAQLFYGLSTNIYLTSVLSLLAFSMFPIMNAHASTIWQEQIPKEFHGRVFAIRRLIAQFTLPIGSALAGWIGADLNPGFAVSLLGAFFGSYCLLMLFNKNLLNIENSIKEDYTQRDGSI